MALNPSNTNNVSSTGPAMGPTWNSYKHDQLVQVRSTVDHAAILHGHAERRIAARNAAVEAAGVSDDDPSHDAGISRFHALRRMLDEVAYYPAHDKRVESPGYAKVHHQMTVADDKHCLVCGVQHSTLKVAEKNPFGAIQMETHHHVIEWALANAIDAGKFNQHILPGLKRQGDQRRGAKDDYDKWPDLYKEFDSDYDAPMGVDRIKQWIDHAYDNLWVLCDVHHRHKFVGIHAISYPIWGPQDVIDQDLVEQEIKQAMTAGANADV